MKSPTVMVGLLGLVLAAWWFSSGSWFSGAAAIAKDKERLAAAKLPPPPAEIVAPSQAARAALPDPITAVRIQGGIMSDKGRLWISDEGRMLTENEIAAESGGTVIPYEVRGVWRLKGSGVKYGSEGLPVQSVPVVDGPRASAPGFVVPPPVTAPQSVEPGPADPFMTPADPLKQPFTMQTPPAPLPRPVR